MKILWFSNSPVSANALKKMNFVGESWIVALEKLISKRNDIELGIVFQNSSVKTIEKHIIDNTKYFICPRSTGMFKRKYWFGSKYSNMDNWALPFYLKVVSEFNPDIIQIFGTENNYGLIVPHVSIPVIFHIQGIILPYNRKYFAGVSLIRSIISTRLKSWIKGETVLHHLKYLKEIEKRENLIYSFGKYFLGRTDWDRYNLISRNKHALYIHCEELLRQEFFENSWDYIKDETINIVSILRADIYKGFDLIHETSEILQNHNIKFTWQVIGTPENDGLVRLYKKKYHGALNKNIKFLGGKSAEEVVSILKNSHLFIHPSYIENSPNSVCEAMLLGMPVIATAVGGVASLIDNNKEGILLQEGDPWAMAGAIMDLCSNPVKMVSMGQRARARAMERHNADAIVSNLISTYQNIINNYAGQ